jgi:sarcosine oxidase subunit alpha
MAAPERRQLIGLLTEDPARVLEEGAQVIAVREGGGKPLGHVTSSYASAVLGHSIALALVAGGRARLGQTLYVADARGAIPVKVTGTVFYDPGGARLNA